MQNRKVVAALRESDLCFNNAVAYEQDFYHKTTSLSWGYCTIHCRRLQLITATPPGDATPLPPIPEAAISQLQLLRLLPSESARPVTASKNLQFLIATTGQICYDESINSSQNLNLTEVSSLKREDAFYHKIMLMSGLDDGYDEWLNHYLESENPLSNIVLELACCGSDVNKTISVLHNYCAEQAFDESVVCTRIRLFFQKAYYSNKMSKEEIASFMYRLANNVGDPGDFDMHLWGSMYYLDYYHDLAKDGLISWDSFNSAFSSYLDKGIPLDSDRIWNHNRIEKPTIVDRIRGIINR